MDTQAKLGSAWALHMYHHHRFVKRIINVWNSCHLPSVSHPWQHSSVPFAVWISPRFCDTVSYYGRPWNRADHYIFMLWFVLLLSSFFPRLISAAADWMSAILPNMVWP